jgi:hypothetical protein
VEAAITRCPSTELGRPAAQRLDVVDAVTTRDQRVDQREQLATRPGRTRTVTQVHQLVGKLLDLEPLGQRRGQQQPRGGDRVVVIEADIDGVENDVGGSHRKGVLRLGVNDCLAAVILPGQEALFIIGRASTDHRIGGSRLRQPLGQAELDAGKVGAIWPWHSNAPWQQGWAVSARTAPPGG